MKIQLGEIIQDQICTIEYFLHPDGGERGMVIVFPGGGYAMLAAHEAEPVAEKFVELGFHAAVCRYRVKPAAFPTPLEDARNAVKYTREHAAELGVKPDKIAVLGFLPADILQQWFPTCPVRRKPDRMLQFSVTRF